MTQPVGQGDGVSCILTLGGLAPETGGPAVTVPALCGALARLGATVELIAMDMASAKRSPWLDEVQPWRLTSVRGFAWPTARVKWAPGFGRTVRRRCRALGDVVLHDNGIWLPSNHSVVRVARALGRPLVVSPRGMLFPWTRRHKALKKTLAWRLYQRRDLRSASVLHATSPEEFEALRALGLRQPVAVVPNAFELPPAISVVRSPGSPRVVLFLSLLTPKKGLDTLLQVWLQLRPQGWKLIIAGPDEGGYGARLRRTLPVNAGGLGIEFVGPTWGEDKWRLFRAADVFVLPSRSENFGVAVAEALASGVPVITTRTTPWRAIEERRCGWWIEAGDAPLAAALREATTLSDRTRSQMGARGRQLIEQEYSPARAAGQMLQLYAWLLRRSPRPDFVDVWQTAAPEAQ